MKEESCKCWFKESLYFKSFIYIYLYIYVLKSGLNLPIVAKDVKDERITTLIGYFTERRNNNEWYAIRFFLCEVLNLVNVIGQIFFMDFFLGGEFTTYGSDLVNVSEQPSADRHDPMSHVFPKV